MERDNLKKALEIYKTLIDSPQGYIEKNSGNNELFADYYDNDVNQILDVICEAFDVRIFKGNRNRLYVVPDISSSFAIKESDVGKYFYVGDRMEAEVGKDRTYLFYYITLIFFNELYGGNPIKQKRDYVPLGELLAIIDGYVEKHRQLTLEEEMSLAFNFIRVGRKWMTLSSDSDKTVTGLSTRLGFARRSMEFLAREELVILVSDDETRIYPTEKLTDYIEKGNLKSIERLNIL
jgi:hypothetical protein